MSNKQFDEVDLLIKASGKKRNTCPTCGAKAIEVGDGVAQWQPSTYVLDGNEHECLCEEQEALFRHYLLARIPHEYMVLSLKDYEGDEQPLEETKEYLRKWQGYRTHGIGLGFYGNQGTGKTFLATWIARELVKKGESVYYVPMRSIAGVFELPYEARKDEEDRLRNCTLLVLDEVFKPSSEAMRLLFADKFEELIRYRTNYDKVTIITTNLTPEKLEEYYPRTSSLLAAKEKVIKVKGEDKRRKDVAMRNEELAANEEVRPIT